MLWQFLFLFQVYIPTIVLSFFLSLLFLYFFSFYFFTLSTTTTIWRVSGLNRYLTDCFIQSVQICLMWLFHRSSRIIEFSDITFLISSQLTIIPTICWRFLCKFDFSKQHVLILLWRLNQLLLYNVGSFILLFAFVSIFKILLKNLIVVLNHVVVLFA